MSIPDSPQPCHQPSAFRHRLAVVIVLVAAVTIWMHWPCVHNDFLQWDDYLYLEAVAQHPHLNWETIQWAFGRTGHDYYSPLTWLSYVANVHHHELSAWVLHRTNVVLHGLNAAWVVVLGDLIFQLAGLPARHRWLTALGVGLVFGLHPVQVESVAWVAERKTVLCGFFCLASACAYLRAVGQGGPRRYGWGLAMLALYVAALLSKPMAVSLPVALLALDIYPLQRFDRPRWKMCLMEKLPLFALAAVDGWLTIHSVNRVNAMETLHALSLFERISITAHAFGLYLWKLVWPMELSPYYAFDGTMHLSRPDVILGLAGIVGLTVLCGAFYRRRPAWAAAWLGFWAFLLPVSGLVQTGAQAAANRYLYLPLVPVALLTATGFGMVWQRFGVAGRGALSAFLAGYLLLVSFQTRAQIAVWRNDETLWRAALRYYPDSGMVNRQLATALQRAHKLAEALVYARRTVALAPQVADAHETLGILYVDLQRCPEAIAELETVLRLDPTSQRALYFIARCQIKLQQPQLAVRTLHRLIELNPQVVPLLRQDPELASLAGEF